jgi:hypothetical protein
LANKRYFKDQTVETQEDIVLYPKHTLGLATPKANSKRACLCADKQTYSVKCCKTYLINQGIGQTEGLPPAITAFKKPDFSTAFS